MGIFKEKKELRPFLKWAGGKRWLTSQYPEFFPKSFKSYIEPFLGSGAVFFHLKPSKAILSDSNKELIETYRVIRDDWKNIVKILKRHHLRHSKNYYYQIRGCVPESKIERAARFIYLNRTCWNGLYRVNLKGEFNVPKGTKYKVITEEDDFERICDLLREVDIRCEDFETIISLAKKDDFLFVDPPYTVTH